MRPVDARGQFLPIGHGYEAPQPAIESDPFTDPLPPHHRARAIAALARQIKADGQYYTRRQLVDMYLTAGANVFAHPTGRRLQKPNGGYVTEAQISKTAMDYAVWRLHPEVPHV